jgi:hypothetical protein
VWKEGTIPVIFKITGMEQLVRSVADIGNEIIYRPSDQIVHYTIVLAIRAAIIMKNYF